MNFDFWLKRQGVTYEFIIEKNNLNSYEELVQYARGLNLSPPVESDASKYFQKEEKPRKGRPSSSLRSTNGSSKTNSSRSNSKSKSVKQKSNNSLRRQSRGEKKRKGVDDKKNRNGRDNSSGE